MHAAAATVAASSLMPQILDDDRWNLELSETEALTKASTTTGSNSVPAPFTMISLASNGDIALR